MVRAQEDKKQQESLPNSLSEKKASNTLQFQPIKPLVAPSNILFDEYTQASLPLDPFDTEHSMSLSLDEVFEKTLGNNLEAKIERDNIKIAGLEHKIAGGSAYAPILSLRADYRDDVLPVSNAILGGRNGVIKNEIWTFGSSLSGVSPLGTEYKLFFDSAKTRTDNFFQILVPEYSSSLGIKITQPLLKDFWINENRQRIKVLKINKKISELEFKSKLIELVYKSQVAYWDLILAYKALDIGVQSVELAEEQLKMTTRMSEVGEGSKIEVVSARAELEKRREELAETVDTIFRTANSLRVLISDDLSSPLWKNRLVPDGEWNEAVDFAPDISAALEESLEKRPEFKALAQKILIKELERKYQVNQALPRADLVGEFRSYGLAGSSSNLQTFNQTDIASVLARYGGGSGKGVENLFSGDYRTVNLGMNFSWPIAPATTKKILNKNALEMEQFKLEFLDLKQKIKAEIYNAYNSIIVTQQRIKAAQSSLENAKTQMEGETQKFQIGMSSNFLVLTRQNDYSMAQLKLAEAIADYNKAISEFKKASGRIVEDSNIAVASIEY